MFTDAKEASYVQCRDMILTLFSSFVKP